MLYVAPERFGSPGFEAAVSRARVGLFVVDEAHCVSQWGHDFRPDYFALADAAAQRLGARATIALTATATPRVADDIARRLRAARPGARDDRLRPSEPELRGRAVRERADKRRRIAAALSEPGRAAGDRLRRHARRERAAGASC